MAVIQLNPRTPGQRFMQIADFSGLTPKKPEKSLLKPLKHSGGRNNAGRMTSRNTSWHPPARAGFSPGPA